VLKNFFYLSVLTDLYLRCVNLFTGDINIIIITQLIINMNTKIITIDPEIMMGKPIIKGTRITVERILEMLAAGETTDQIIEAYPFLSK
jgi:uncharacterized protein (DUF433 family)